MTTSTEALNGIRQREGNLQRRTLNRLGAAALGVVLLFGVSEARPYVQPRLQRSLEHGTKLASSAYDSITDLLNSLSYEPRQYDNPLENTIYEEVALGRAGKKQLPVIEGVLAVSNTDMRAQADQLPSFALRNPVLVDVKNGDQTDQYLVAHNGRTADTLKDLLYIPLQDAQFCTTMDGMPKVVNTTLGSKRLSRSFEAPNVGTVVYVPEDIAAGCQREVAVSEINNHTLHPAA
ncbi:MAG TPA: hypothetical protein VM124_01115 [Candidatus Limnocylindrales bacterium]|nr:hypothetical protein [Candidatus Limnocylindrales bacterium]